jgi:hypothetical protein
MSRKRFTQTMIMKNLEITGLLMCGMLAGMAQGATIRYRQTGDWTLTAPANTGPGWQNASAVPTTADLGRINWGGNTVTVSTTAQIGALQIGVDESGTLLVADGGSLTTVSGSGQNGRLTVGNNNSAATGTMTVQSGGTVNVGEILFIGAETTGQVTVAGSVTVASHLWMGTTSGVTGTLSISGSVTVSGNIGLGTGNASTASGGSATINVLDGGLLSLDRWSSTNSIFLGSILNINEGGTVTIGGNRVTAANDYFANGLIGTDGTGIEATYDSDLNLTTIVAIPEPGSPALVGLAGLGLLTRRRRSMTH